MFICSVAPPFTLLASCRAGVRLMRSQKMQEAHNYLKELTCFYLDTLTSHPVYKKAYKKGMVDMPVHEDGAWHEVPITHIVPLWTRRPKYALYLAFHLTRDGFNGCNIVFPIVPKGEERVQLFLHAHNTKDEVKGLITSITTWIQEMLDIEASGDKNKLPAAARLAFDILEKDEQTTNGTNSAATENANGVDRNEVGNESAEKETTSKEMGSKNLLSGISAFKNRSLVSGMKIGEMPSRII